MYGILGTIFFTYKDEKNQKRQESFVLEENKTTFKVKGLNLVFTVKNIYYIVDTIYYVSIAFDNGREHTLYLSESIQFQYHKKHATMKLKVI